MRLLVPLRLFELPRRALKLAPQGAFYRPLLAVVLAGLVIRIIVMVTYSTSVFLFQTGDSARYARLPLHGVSSGLFSDYASPAGYPIFLALTRSFSRAMPFTIAVQHGLGIVSALLLYATMRRVGASKIAATVPAALVLLSGDEIFLEHVLLTESLWTLLVFVGLYGLIRAAQTRQPPERWLVVGGVGLACATLVRQVTAPLLVIAAIFGAVCVAGSVGRRIRAAALVIGSAAALLLLYAGIAHLDGGNTGLGKQTGFQLYGRVAQFADCRRFTPPRGTRVLCQQTPSSDRAGPQYYLFGDTAPLARHFRRGYSDKALGEFARLAIIHQPGAYAGAVLEEFARIVGFRGARPGDGYDPNIMRFDHQRPSGAIAKTAEGAMAVFASRYTHMRAVPHRGWARRLGLYQAIVRLHEQLVIPLALLALLGALFASARMRAGIVLFITCAFALYVLPSMTALWDVRYGVLPGEILASAATLGASALAIRFSQGLLPLWTTLRRRVRGWPPARARASSTD
jgi:hypothetical protein